MSGLFGSSPKPLPPPTVVPIPTVNQETVDRNVADIMRRRKGSAATVITEGMDDSTSGSVAAKSLLGS